MAAESVEMAALLCQWGDARGTTPLMRGVERNNQLLVETLLGLGADRAARNADGKTPLDIARERGFEFLAMLLE